MEARSHEQWLPPLAMMDEEPCLPSYSALVGRGFLCSQQTGEQWTASFRLQQRAAAREAAKGEGGKIEAKRGGEDRGKRSGGGVRMRGIGERKMN